MARRKAFWSIWVIENQISIFDSCGRLSNRAERKEKGVPP